MKYRKRPVVIEAIQWTGKNLVEITEFVEQIKIDFSSEVVSNKWDDYRDIVRENGLVIKTLEGDMNANVDDFIIKGIKGEFYPCKPDVFEKTYEFVED